MEISKTIERANLARISGAGFHLSDDEMAAIINAADGRIWKHRFVAKFADIMRASGYDADDIFEVSYQYADACWPERDPTQTPEQEAKGQYEAMGESD